MKVLLTGILPSYTPTIAARLVKGGHQVSVIGPLESAARLGNGIRYHDVSSSDPDALRLMEASGYEAVLFFFACQCEADGESDSVKGAQLDALYAMLRQGGRSNVRQFVL